LRCNDHSCSFVEDHLCCILLSPALELHTRKLIKCVRTNTRIVLGG
jgi:hypothetical protein